MEYHRLDEMLDYHSRCEAEMDFEATGECECESWMFDRNEDGYECTICGSRISEDEFDERFPLPF
jgi:hypothetical protein